MAWLIITRRYWVVIILFMGFAAFLAWVSSHQRKNLQELEQQLALQKPVGDIFESPRKYPVAFDPQPLDVSEGTVRIAAALGELDRFEPLSIPEVDLNKIDTPLYYRVTANEFLKILPGRFRKVAENKFEQHQQGSFIQLENKKFVYLPDRIFVHSLAPRLRDFANHYRINIEIFHLPPGELVIPALKRLGKDPATFDLILAPRFLLESLEHKKGLQKLQLQNLPNHSAVTRSFLASFPSIPEDRHFEYSVPYYATSLGIFYRFDSIQIPPTDWIDFYTSERVPLLWGKAAHVDHLGTTFGMALIFLESLKESEETDLLEQLPELLQLAQKAQSISNHSARTAALNKLLHAFTEIEYPKDSFDQFGIHQETFDDRISHREHANLSDEAEKMHLRQSSAELLLEAWETNHLQHATDLLKKSVLFGARFREVGDLLGLHRGDYLITPGIAAEMFHASQVETRNIRFVIPESGTFVSTWVFTMPDGIDDARRRRAEFLLNHLLKPQVMASMTEFSFLANVSGESVPFVNSSLLNSAIYTFPPPGKTYYLPVFDGHTSLVTPYWQEVRGLAETLNRLDWAPSAGQRTTSILGQISLGK